MCEEKKGTSQIVKQEASKQKEKEAPQTEGAISLPSFGKKSKEAFALADKLDAMSRIDTAALRDCYFN